MKPSFISAKVGRCAAMVCVGFVGTGLAMSMSSVAGATTITATTSNHSCGSLVGGTPSPTYYCLPWFVNSSATGATEGVWDARTATYYAGYYFNGSSWIRGSGGIPWIPVGSGWVLISHVAYNVPEQVLTYYGPANFTLFF